MKQLPFFDIQGPGKIITFTHDDILTINKTIALHISEQILSLKNDNSINTDIYQYCFYNKTICLYTRRVMLQTVGGYQWIEPTQINMANFSEQKHESIMDIH